MKDRRGRRGIGDEGLGGDTWTDRERTTGAHRRGVRVAFGFEAYRGTQQYADSESRGHCGLRLAYTTDTRPTLPRPPSPQAELRNTCRMNPPGRITIIKASSVWPTTAHRRRRAALHRDRTGHSTLHPSSFPPPSVIFFGPCLGLLPLTPSSQAAL